MNIVSLGQDAELSDNYIGLITFQNNWNAQRHIQ
jgi:hypothetical protein